MQLTLFSLFFICSGLIIPSPWALGSEADLNYSLAIQSFSAANYAKAVSQFETASRQDPENTKATYYHLVARGLLSLQKHNTNAAFADLKRASEVLPSEALAFYYLGLTEQARAHDAASIGYFEQAAKLDKKLAAASNYYAALGHLKLKDTPHAIEKLETTRHYFPQSPFAGKATSLLNQLDAAEGVPQQRFQFLAQLGLEYDSNVILEPEAIEVSNEDDFRAVVLLQSNLALAPWNLSYQFYQNLHLELDDFNVQNHRLGVDWFGRSGSEQKPLQYGVRLISAASLLSNRFEYFNWDNAIEPYWIQRYNKNYTLGLQLHSQYVDYRSADDLRDNLGYGLTVSQLLNSSDKKFFAGVKGGMQFENAKQEYDLIEFQGDANFGLVWKALQVSLQATFEHALYFHSESGREDNRLTAGAEISYTFHKFPVNLGYQFIQNASNVAQFDYLRTIISIHLGYNF